MDHRALDVCSKLHNELHLAEHVAYHSSTLMFLLVTPVEYLPILIPMKMYFAHHLLGQFCANHWP
jgi:hypothetical protein